jgi:hypothetical protein
MSRTRRWYAPKHSVIQFRTRPSRFSVVPQIASRRRVHAGCDQPFFPEEQIEGEVLAVLSAMATPDGLAEAVEVAISKYASQQRKLSRGSRRKMIDQQLKRIAELYEIGDYTKEVYDRKRAELMIERDSLEVVPASASLSLQRQRIQAVVDDWPEMTGDERKRMLQLIFSEIRADHVNGKLVVTFKALPHLEPYVEAVLAKKKAAESGSDLVSTSERKTGVKHAEVITARLVQDDRGWLRLAG